VTTRLSPYFPCLQGGGNKNLVLVFYVQCVSMFKEGFQQNKFLTYFQSNMLIFRKLCGIMVDIFVLSEGDTGGGILTLDKNEETMSDLSDQHDQNSKENSFDEHHMDSKNEAGHLNFHEVDTEDVELEENNETEMTLEKDVSDEGEPIDEKISIETDDQDEDEDEEIDEVDGEVVEATNSEITDEEDASDEQENDFEECGIEDENLTEDESQPSSPSNDNIWGNGNGFTFFLDDNSDDAANIPDLSPTP